MKKSPIVWLLAWASTDNGRNRRTYLTGFSRSGIEALWSTDRMVAMLFGDIGEMREAALATQGRPASPPLADLMGQKFAFIQEMKLFGGKT